MNAKRTHFLLAGIALSLGLSQLAFAAEDPAAGKIDETKSHERGVMWAPMTTPTGGAAPLNVPVMKKPDVTKAIQQITTVKPVKTTKVIKPVVTAVKRTTTKQVIVKTKVTPTIAKTNKPATPTKVEAAAGLSTALVKFSQDGPVVTASLDHSGNHPKYKVGDKLVVAVKAHQDCNVVIFNYDSTGTLTQIFPNDYQQNGFVKAGENLEIGGAESQFDYQIAGKGGAEKIFVYAYPTGAEKPAAITTVAMNPISGTPFRGGEMTVDQYRKMVSECNSYGRSVQVSPKNYIRQVSSTTTGASSSSSSSPNKIELSFEVEK